MRHSATALIAASVLVNACNNRVPVPIDPSVDRAPMITLSGLVAAGAGEIEPDKEVVTGAATVKVTRGASILLTGRAVNPGGVESMAITAIQLGVPLFDARTTTTKDAGGLVPNAIVLLGSGPLLDQPMRITVRTPVTVSVAARNFSNISTTFVVNYVPADFELAFSASPADIGYQKAPSSTLTWSALYGTPPYTTTITPSVSASSLVSVGGAIVQPSASTTYTLKVKDQTKTLTATAFVGVTRPPSPPTITSFTASPNNGYNDLGTTDMLSWSISDCPLPDCNVTLKGTGTGYASNEKTFLPHLPASHSVSYKPNDITNFVLSATSQYGSGSPKTAQLAIAPTQAKPTGPVITYFFTVLNNNAGALFACSLVSMAALTESDAEKLVLNIYQPGYSIGKQLTEGDFANGIGC